MKIEGARDVRPPGDQRFSRTFVNAFFALYFVIGLGLIAYTPPFQSPDAFAHFDRAAGIASGQLIASVHNNYAGSYLPVGVIDVEDDFSTLPFNPNSRVTRTQYPVGWLRSWNSPPAFIQYTTGGNLPFLYLPQVAGIVVGRALSEHVLVSLYLAQLFNFLTFIALTRFAFARLPRHLAIPMGIFLMLPTVITVAKSVNPDSLVLSLSVVFATMCYLGFSQRTGQPPRPTRRSRSHRRHPFGHLPNLTYWVAFASLLFMTLEKPPLAILCLLLPMADSTFSIRRYLQRVSVFVASFAIPFAIWATFGSRGQDGVVSPGKKVATQQLIAVLTNPLRDVIVLYHTLHYWGWLLTSQAVAGIAWLDIFFPTWFYVSLVVIFVVALFSAVRHGRQDRRRIGLSLLVVLVTALATAFSLYILANQYGSPMIFGLQGRYFLPMLPITIVVVGAHSTQRPLSRVVATIVDDYASLSLISLQILIATEVFVVIRNRYWVK